VSFVLEGYEPDARGLFDETFEARVLWDKLHHALEALQEDPPRRLPLEELRRFMPSILHRRKGVKRQPFRAFRA